jgi:hypothetical protein
MHVFDNHRRGRTTFSVRGAFERAYTRYHEKLREMSKAWAFLNEIFTATDGVDYYANGEFSDGISRAHALASSLTFDHFTRMLTRPTSGEHFNASPDAVGQTILRSTDQSYFANDPAVDRVSGQPQRLVTIPEGTRTPGSAPSLGGRPLHNALDQSKGYYATSYDLWVGSYYDKTLALDLLADSTDRFISQSRDDFVDGRYRNVSFATLYPEAMRRLVANALTDDADILGWRVPTRANGSPMIDTEQRAPLQPMGFPLWWPADGPRTCWPVSGSLGCSEPSTQAPPATPQTSMAIDPELGFEVQKFVAFFSLIYLPESWKRDWVDMMRVYRVGTDPEPPFPAEERIVFRDPFSGNVYVAHAMGTETIAGRVVQRGVAARMLEWANTLARKAYVVESEDPVTHELSFTRYAPGDACPPAVFSCAGTPQQNSALNAPLFVTRLKGYMGLIDFVRLATAELGFGLGWRGVY